MSLVDQLAQIDNQQFLSDEQKLLERYAAITRAYVNVLVPRLGLTVPVGNTGTVTLMSAWELDEHGHKWLALVLYGKKLGQNVQLNNPYFIRNPPVGDGSDEALLEVTRVIMRTAMEQA